MVGSCSLLVVADVLEPVTTYRLPTTDHQPLTTNYQPRTVLEQLPAARPQFFFPRRVYRRQRFPEGFLAGCVELEATRRQFGAQPCVRRHLIPALQPHVF